MNNHEKLSPEQIKNWRKILTLTLGPYALLMPDKEVQRHRDKMQQHVDEHESDPEKIDERSLQRTEKAQVC